jgi:alkanesulfonate monooxygenase SsuD/methylene tetrahydromethanopterin reductase-like flavin-dependent oxidoreductase (luciferase family)
MAAHRPRYPNERIGEIRDIAEEQREAAPDTQVRDRFVLQAAVLGDPDAAAALLTDLIDSGHDGTLVSAQIGDSVIYEIHLGPFQTLSQANTAGEAVRRSHDLTPAILVLDQEEPR